MRAFRTRRGLIGLIAGASTVFAAAASAQSWTNASESGVLIASVDPEGPAGNSGLKRGDIIVVANGEEVDGVRAFVAAIAEIAAGDTVTVQAMRGTSRRTFNIAVTENEGRPYLGVLMGRDGASARTFGDVGERGRFGDRRQERFDELRRSGRRPGIPLRPQAGAFQGAAAS